NSLIDELGPESILPGALETVKSLRDMGVKTAVASSSENANGILRQFKIRTYFDAIVDGGDIERGKPDPEAFLLAARRLSTPIRECLVIENSEAGMTAAKDAGMRAVMVDGSVKELSAKKIYPSLSDIDFSRLLYEPESEKR
ncbi:MAG: HAD-IA family hydrolase, partial [Clostridia bacterium]|nr:HAD-IA family hydrolase [Clostridia bacterium]